MAPRTHTEKDTARAQEQWHNSVMRACALGAQAGRAFWYASGGHTGSDMDLHRLAGLMAPALEAPKQAFVARFLETVHEFVERAAGALEPEDWNDPPNG